MKKYLKKIYFEFDTTCCGPTLKDAETSEQRKEIMELGRKINRRLIDLFVICDRLYESLKRQKILLSPHVAITYFHLTDAPRSEPFYEYLALTRGQGPGPQLWVDVDFHPLKLLDLPNDAEVVGELAIRLLLEGLKKLEGYDGFPSELVHQAISEFRDAGYADSWKAVEKTIPGTKVKGRIDVTASASKTVAFLTLSFRGRQLGRIKFWERDGNWAATASLNNNFSYQDGHLTIFRDENHHVPHASLSLAELPEEFQEYIVT